MSNQGKPPADPRFNFPFPGSAEGYPPDRRFDVPFPNNADGMHNPPPGTDRFPRRDVVLPVPPPRTNGGADGMGAPPRRDKRRSRSMGCNIIANGPSGQVASWDTGADENGEESSTVISFLKAYDFAENAVTGLGGGPHADPFEGVVSLAINQPGTLQSLEVLVNLQWGHDGVSQKVVANLPAGQIVKAVAAGTYCRAHCKIVSRYTTRFSGPAFGGSASFFYLDPDANKRNNIWNSIDSPALSPSQYFDSNTMPLTPIHVDGIIGMGTPAVSQGGSFDRSSRLTRRFFGSVPTTAGVWPGGGAIVLCPVAFGASAVMLQANATPFTLPAGRALAPLFMGFMDGAGNFLGGQFPSNTFFTIPPETRQIFVYNPTLANQAENPFSLVYDLGL
jgi:hypothetical protein